VTVQAASRRIAFTGADRNGLVGDVFGEARDDDAGPTHRPVLLLHGGGQTRYAWRNTADRLAQAGMTAYATPSGSRTAPTPSMISPPMPTC
jgi:pimeloyl-ACP methyl ester carboxylesterase